MLIRTDNRYYEPVTDIAIKMALEIENTMNYLAAYKELTAQEIQAANRLNKKLGQLFEGVFDETLSRFDELSTVPSTATQRKRIIQAIANMGDDYKNIAAEEAVNSARRGYKKEVLALRSIGLEIFKEEITDHVIDLIKNHSFIASDHTKTRITGNVMENLAKSYEEGLGIKEARERLAAEFVDMKTHQLNTIARTETICLQNEGQFQAKVENHVEYHQWWTGQDERVRGNPSGLYPDSEADHWELHGQIVKVGEPFSNGLKYPGDRSGGSATIKEWINCRCAELDFYMPEGYTAPIGKTYFYEEDLIKKEENNS